MPEAEVRQGNVTYIQSRPQPKRDPNIAGHVSLTFGDTTHVGYVARRSLLAAHLGVVAAHGENASEALIALAEFGLKAYLWDKVPDCGEIKRSVGVSLDA